MTGTEFVTKCKKGITGGFFIFGDEGFLVNKCREAAAQYVPDEGTEDFNYIKLSANDAGYLELLEEAVMTLPMFSAKKLVWLTSYKSTCKEEEKQQLFDVLALLKENPETVLVIEVDGGDFDPGKLPKAPSKAYKELAMYLEPVNCERQTAARLAGWAAKRFASNRILADSAVIHYMIEYCSADMYSLQNEVDKLSYYLAYHNREKLEYEDVLNVCSRGKIDIAFEFSNALLDGDTARALSLVLSMQRRKERPEIPLGELVAFAANMYTVKVLSDGGMSKEDISKKTGLHAYRVGLYATAASKRGTKRLANLVELCREADVKIKSTPLDSYIVLEKLVLEACTVKK